MTNPPRLLFSVRYPVGQGRYRYRRVFIAGPGGAGCLTTDHVPAAGDLISLWDAHGPQPEGGPIFVVVRRSWQHAGFGSANWPYGTNEPLYGPMVDIIVEPSEQGVYADETDICADPDCEAYAVFWGAAGWRIPPGGSTGEEGHQHRKREPKP